MEKMVNRARYRLDEVARMAGITPGNLYSRMDAGAGPRITRFGGINFVTPDDAESFAQQVDAEREAHAKKQAEEARQKKAREDRHNFETHRERAMSIHRKYFPPQES
jgi:hypothetical protein